MLANMSPEALAMHHHFLEAETEVWSYYADPDEQRRYNDARAELKG